MGLFLFELDKSTFDLMRFWLLLCCLLSMIQLTGQFTSDDFSGGNLNTLNSDQFNVDSTVRPPLLIILKSLRDNETYEELDTLYHRTHIVEPIYHLPDYPLNLGSENSAAQSFPIQFYNDIGIELGHFQYRTISDQYDPYDYHDVNRSYWAIHYGKGVSINSSNLDVNFYRKFARGIILNFDYRTASDDSWFQNQENDFSNFNIKLVQESNKNRRSYILYRSLNLSEEHTRTLDFESMANSAYSDFIIEVGNSKIIKDSLANNKKLTLETQAGYKTNTYEFIDNLVTGDEIVLFAPIDTSLVRYGNRLRSLYINNELQLSSDQYSISGGISYYDRRYRNTIDTTSFEELHLSVKTKHLLNRNQSIELQGQIGLLDAGGDLSYKGVYAGKVKRTPIEINFNVSILDPTLFQRRAYNASNLIWSNEFAKSTKWNLGLQTNLYGFDLNVTGGQLSNGVFISPFGRPFQDVDPLSYFNLSLNKSLDFWFLKTKHRLSYQYVSNNVILAPDFQLNGSVNTDFYWSKYNALIELGVDYYFIPSFISPQYQPVFGVFYNDGSAFDSGTTLIVNPFITINVDTLAFFIKTNNALSAFLNRTSFSAESYNIYNYRLTFGVKWRLLD